MALKTYGLVGIPRDVEVKEVQIQNGWYLTFLVSSPNPDNKQRFYRYPMRLWVPDREKEKMLERIVGGAVFSIETAHWAMKEYSGGKYPIPELQTTYRDFIKLESPLWYKKEKSEQNIKHQGSVHRSEEKTPAGDRDEVWESKPKP
jgi:hypothetical protein